MYLLLSIFTDEEETVLDPFNGVGTTSLAAQQLNRKYIGIELSEYYHNIALQRHNELFCGIDPFRKNNDNTQKAKNSPVERMKKQKYNVSKKILQLEIKAISEQIGHIPSKKEVENYSKYPIEYFENYFFGWGEVTAAARTTGMTENKSTTKLNSSSPVILDGLREFFQDERA
jgi:site-specific DNA-methyltransferase (adenine-specific)